MSIEGKLNQMPNTEAEPNNEKTLAELNQEREEIFKNMQYIRDKITQSGLDTSLRDHRDEATLKKLKEQKDANAKQIADILRAQEKENA
ncbi:MAG: hypothetical protein Q8Q23_03455 [bacterium]|nr:hypothetical protein [bacterium]